MKRKKYLMLAGLLCTTLTFSGCGSSRSDNDNPTATTAAAESETDKDKDSGTSQDTDKDKSSETQKESEKESENESENESEKDRDENAESEKTEDTKKKDSTSGSEKSPEKDTGNNSSKKQDPESGSGTTAGNSATNTQTNKVHTHTYTSSITKQPTCTTNGILTYTCSICGTAYSLELGALGHDLETVTESATCQKTGSEHTYCRRESCSYSQTKEIPKTDHIWDGGVTDVYPTCSTEGIKTYHCMVCDTVRTENLGLGDHNWEYKRESHTETHVYCFGCKQDFGSGPEAVEAVAIHLVYNMDHGSYYSRSYEIIDDEYYLCSACGARKEL